MLTKEKSEKNWVVGISGSSGVQYALTLIDFLSSPHSQEKNQVHVVISESALRVLNEELDLKFSQSTLNTKALIGQERENVKFYNPKDIGAWFASGSTPYEGMVIVPCSMASLGMIANGCGYNLIHRAADVCIKENRKLVIVPRETPLSAIHLQNMLKLSQLGVKMLPAMPGFYSKPQSIQDIVDAMVMKILDSMGIENRLSPRWREEDKSSGGIQESVLIPLKGGRS